VRDNAKLLGAIVLVLLVLALGALVLVPRVRARRAAQRASRAPLDARVLLAFARLEAALAGSHLARPPDGSVEEMWETLRLRWPGGLPETSRVAAALRTVQRILYGSAAVPARDALDAVAAMDLLASQAVDLLPRRRPHLVR
jgi:type II secretory pathway pseudopilin PulG